MTPPNRKFRSGDWIASYPAEIMVCDEQGIILEMNQVAADIYAGDGGYQLIGHNVFDHHPAAARNQLKDLVERRQPVIYTTEKSGLKKLVSIAPWYRDGRYAGFTLFVLDLPADLPNIHKDTPL